MNAIIELKGISRTYTNGGQALTVLKDIDLTIAAGELVAIIGASGSGKSTLMNIMGCLDVPDRGDYYISGQNAAHLSPDELARLRREHIGFIFQRYHLMPDLSALGNVEIPAIYANARRDQRRQRAAQLLARLGLEGREDHKPGQLSGGQQQRVSIARSLINGGEIILADEPTGALDTQSGQEVLAQQSFVDSVSPEVSASDSIRFRSKSATASITGVGRDYFRVNGITLVQGATFRDDRNALQEVIIDDNARQALFGDFGVEPLGQIVFLGSVPARVVGVAKSERNYAPNRISVWMPYSTVMYRMVGKTTLSGITVRLKDDVASEAAVSAITQLLTQRHGVKDFMTFNRDQFRKSIERTSMTLSLLILMVASISLVIGSLGVMNIMLVSVTERTHEIGVRMAVGARRGDIMQQFMIEAVLVCLIGGALGIALSFAAGSLFTSLAGGMFTAIYSWQAAATAFFCSTLIGMIFGYLPARKAARMDPVVSLASE
ncbi:ATP-binding cassette domain-containing protein [Serratia marcescens]|nr:ATP-binding cassette domain-containing protein [Serratia marcescens]ELQ9441678.1 ATP-binding cassette domain-containing protein [Serratia marcescens]ELT5562642.1 ATP-binding cassette domain-containing protein [Serratia marcescens]